MMRMNKGIVFVAMVALPVVGFSQETTNTTWKSSIGLGVTYKSGNTDKTLYTMNLKGDRYTPKSDWINSLYGEYGKTEGSQTEGQLRGQSNYRYKFDSENFYGGIFAEGYHDAIKDINVRAKIGPNVGYYFINKEDVKLDGNAGINAVYESNATSEDTHAEWRVAGSFIWSLNQTASCYANAEYSAAVDEYQDGLGLLVVGAKSKMSEKLSMFIEVREEYDNMPTAGTEYTDTTVLAGLAYDIM